MTVDIFAVSVFCVIAALLCLILRQYKPEYSLLLSLACSAAVIAYALTSLSSVTESISSIIEDSLIPTELTEVLFKCTGVCILSELASQTCRDAGEGAIASKIELAGKLTLIILSMPLFLKLLETSSMLMSIGR